MDDAPSVEHWLALLRDGSLPEQQRARTELGLILEARGFLDDAADAYERNVGDGVADRRPYDRLAAIARQRGDAETEARVLRALAEVLAPSPNVTPEPAEGDLAPRPADVDLAPEPADVDLAPEPADVDLAPEPADVDLTPPPPLRRGEGETNGTGSPSPRRRGGGGVRSPGRWLLAAGGVAVVAVVIGGAMLVPLRPPTPAPPALASPSPVELSLRTDVTGVPASPTLPPPSPSPTAPVSSPTPAPSPTATTAPLATRCTNAAERFPETRDTQAAVRVAYAEYMGRQGVTIDPTSTLFTGQGAAYAERHAEVVAGWMAVSLQRERRGLQTFPLVDYVASDVVVATGQDEFQLRATMSPQGWTELRALSSDTCEGAFLKHPDNARWVDLMQATVGDITWAIPTPQPRR